MRALTGQKGVKCKLFIMVHEVKEVPSPPPSKGLVEVSRGSHKITTEAAFCTAACIIQWEQELSLPVTMYPNSYGGFDDKEVKFVIKDSSNGKQICKAVINISEQMKEVGARAQVKLLLDTRSRGILGNKRGGSCPLRVTMRLEEADKESAQTPSAKPAPQQEHDNSEWSHSEALGNSDTDDDIDMPSAPPQKAGNPFDADSTPSSTPKRKPATTGGITKGRHNRRPSSGNPWDASPAPKPPRTPSAPAANAGNPFDAGAKPAPPQIDRAKTEPASSSADYADNEDRVLEIEVLKMRLKTAEKDARESREQLLAEKQLARKMLEEERAKNSSTSATASAEDAKLIEKLEHENEGLKMQVDGLKSALEVATATGVESGGYMQPDDRVDELNERISWLETELVFSKMKLAEAAAQGYIESST